MAGRIPQSFINDLLARLDIVDVIDARITLKKAGKNYQALCPFHDEKTPSFSVSPDKGFYHCFGCGVSGTAITFVMEHDRLEFVDAVETLARHLGVEVPREVGGRRNNSPDNKRLYEVLVTAERYFRDCLRDAPQAVEYLKRRGLTGIVARDFAIGFAPDEWHALGNALSKGHAKKDLLDAGLLTSNDKQRVYDRFRGRIMFPIRDTRGRVIGFGGRVLDNGSGPKYLNSPETPVFHKGREMYGLFEARKALRQIEKLIVVEGYMDVVALAQSGIANCVASLGTATTTEHFHKLYRYTDEVACCFDGDAAGRQAAWRALESALPTLTEGRQLKFMFLPEGEDPDSLVRRDGKTAFLARLEAASPAIEYLFARLGDGLDLAQLDGQAKLASLIVPFIERVPEGILKQLMAQRLEALTGLAPSGPPPAVLLERQRDRPSVVLSGLQRRLLRCLLRSPRLAAELDGPTRNAVESLSGDDVFADIVNYIANNAHVDQSEIVGRWTGHAVQGELLELLERPVNLSESAMASEFVEGMVRYVEAVGRRERRAVLARLKAEPSEATFRELWRLSSSRGESVAGESRPGGMEPPEPGG